MNTTSELLDHLRTALSSEVTTDEAAAALGKLKDGIREIDQLRARVAELELWKSEQLAVESTWDAQAVAGLLGIGLGMDIRSNIQPKIVALMNRINELEKDSVRYHWLCRHLSSDWMIEEDEVTDFVDLDQWEKEGGNDDAPEVQKAWNLIIDQHKAQQ